MQASTKVTRRTTTAASGDHVAVLAFVGDISSASRETILAAYHGIDEAVAKILLDFRSVDYINSSGIAIIIQMLMEARKAGRRSIGIFGLTPHFTKVFTMVGVPKYATLATDEAGVLKNL